MICKTVRFFSLALICVAFFSCGDAKDLIKDQVISSLTDSAINSSTDSDSNSDYDADTEMASEKNSKSSNKNKYSGSSSGDAHFIVNDDYFIAQEPYKSGWIRVLLSKQVSPASKETKNEGKFMVITSGEEIWTKYFWKTKIAAESDLKIGKIVIASEAHTDENGVYQGPENKSEAHDSWFMSKITDMSDKHKGYVTVAGGYKVSLDALRITVAVK